MILRDLTGIGARVSVVVPDATRRQESFPGSFAVHSSISDVGDIDGIIVATPTATHASVIRESLDRGVPIFCEKPLTDSVEDARSIVSEAGDRVFVMDKWRYHPGVEKMRDIVATQQFGPALALDTVRTQWGNPHADVDCAWILLPHDLSIALEILGEVPTPLFSSAVVNHGELEQITTSWAFADGRPMTSVVGTRTPKSIRRITLHCAEAVITLEGGWSDHLEVHTTGTTNGPQSLRFETPGQLPLVRELESFLNHLSGGPAPRSLANEALATVRAIAFARELAGIA